VSTSVIPCGSTDEISAQLLATSTTDLPLQSLASTPWLNPSHQLGKAIAIAAGTKTSWASARPVIVDHEAAAALLLQLDQDAAARRTIQAKAKRDSSLAMELDPAYCDRSTLGLRDAPTEVAADAQLRLAHARQYKDHKPAATSTTPTTSTTSTQQRKVNKRRGRPKKTEQVPAAFNNKWLEISMSRLGLTKSEKAIARNVLNILRTQYINTLPTPKGKVIQRNKLGTRTVVASTFRKLRQGGVITQTNRIASNSKGNAGSGVTNLGPAFFDTKRLAIPVSEGQKQTPSEGQKRDPRSPIFDPTKPIANTDLNDQNATRALNTLYEGFNQGEPLASAPLRAAASGPPKISINQSTDSDVDLSMPNEDQTIVESKINCGDVVEIKGQQGRWLIKGLDWGDDPSQDIAKCVSVEDDSRWITARISDVTLVVPKA
jgi:hypothetical protein